MLAEPPADRFLGIVVFEGRHKDLGLKDLGGTEISGRLFLGSWLICGSEYAVLVDTEKNLVSRRATGASTFAALTSVIR
jgi:hypothetical protein